MNWPDLSATIEALSSAYRACRLCPRACGADRWSDDPAAFCGLSDEAWVYKELLSHGEESVLGPTWLVDLSGCSLRCVFCSEGAYIRAPHAPPAVPLRPSWFETTASRRLAQGAQTLTLVGGEPSVNLLGVLRTLHSLPPPLRLPVIWNTNGWMSPEARRLLRPLVSCWSVDLKFGNDTCARRLARTGPLPYLSEVHATLDEAYTLSRDEKKPLTTQKPAEDPPELPRLIIRHLLLPGHLDCCTRPVLETIAARWPEATVNLMTHYLPFGEAAKRPRGERALGGLNRPEDVQAAVELARALLPRLLINGAVISV